MPCTFQTLWCTACAAEHVRGVRHVLPLALPSCMLVDCCGTIPLSHQVHQYVMLLFAAVGFAIRGAHIAAGQRLVMGWDNGCHLRAFGHNPKRLHNASPLAKQFAELVDVVGA